MDSEGEAIASTERTRTLVLAARVEPATLSTKVLETAGGSGIGGTTRLFNTALTLRDERGTPQPYLTEAIPRLNSDAWTVFPDGRMRTIYRLRPDLTWHDGQPLTADDFVFAWRLYTTPEYGETAQPPQSAMEEVSAPDPRTLVITWRRPFRDAAELSIEFPPMPRHLLEQTWQSQPATVPNLSFWTTEYVGAGPYQLERWVAGSSIDAIAFAGHVGGQPAISRIRVLFISDANTAVTTLLAGEVQATLDDVIRYQQGAILRRQWAASQAGTIFAIPDQWRRTEFQHRPEYANPRSLSDPRVRRALAHGLDRQALVDALFEGEGLLADSPVPTSVDYYDSVRPLLVGYGYEPQRVAQLMTEAGFTRTPDGWASPSDGRPIWELKVVAGTQAESEMSIMAAGWRQLGFDMREAVLPTAQSRDGQIRGTFPTMFTGGGLVGDSQLSLFISGAIPRAENRWVGQNRGGWSNAEYDRLEALFNDALDRTERGRLVGQMVRIFSEDAAAVSLYFNPGIVAFSNQIDGPVPTDPESIRTWNIQRWRWK
jgi:peptide/nickel transport system substrate-binding protein